MAVKPSSTILWVAIVVSSCLAAVYPSTYTSNKKFHCVKSSEIAFVSAPQHHHYASPMQKTITKQKFFYLSTNNNENRRLQSLTQKAAPSSDDITSGDDGNTTTTNKGVRARVRESISKTSQRVQNLVSKSSKTVPIISDGAPIADLLTDAAMNAAELAAEEVRAAAFGVLQRTQTSLSPQQQLETQARIEADATVAMDTISLAKTTVADAFDAAEGALAAVEKELLRTRNELEVAKKDATLGLAVAEKAAAAAATKARMITNLSLKEILLREEKEGAQQLVANENDGDDSGEEVLLKSDETLIVTIPKSEVKEESATNSSGTSSSSSNSLVDIPSDDNDNAGVASLPTKWSESDFDTITGLSYEDVDYTLTDMAPPFINEDECLVPGEPVVRVEKAPQNSRRIFAGIDIPVSVDDVWELLTDYINLQKVVPNLVVNEVLELYDGGTTGKITIDDTMSDAEQCRTIADKMKGAVLKQVGGAKVVGINFSARTTLEVREWPGGMPDFAHFEDEIFEGKSRSTRVRESKGRELTRYVFPRPFALSTLPHKDISMQSIANDDGEFRMYQGVWRMQPLPGCSPADGSAMRLTYAVEVSPRPYLPVALVERRIAQDLCANLKAIRNIFEARASET